jgi:hypothetical protein
MCQSLLTELLPTIQGILLFLGLCIAIYGLYRASLY